MKKLLSHLLILNTLAVLLASCGTSAPSYNYKELARASIRLRMDIDMKDNHRLYVESAEWLGVPYRGGGNNKRGIDCSGLTSHLYKKVYRKKLERNSDDQRTQNCRKVSKSNLREGDLVFFHNGHKKRVASHVGIYLKDNKFIHASTSRGVIVSNLNEEYYRKHWLSGGRVSGKKEQLFLPKSPKDYLLIPYLCAKSAKWNTVFIYLISIIPWPTHPAEL